MTRFTSFRKKTHLPASDFTPKPLLPPKSTPPPTSPSHPTDSTTTTTTENKKHRFNKVKTGRAERRIQKTEKERSARSARRKLSKYKNMVCFGCRQTGHSIHDCPDTKANVDDNDSNSLGMKKKTRNTNIVACYKCGSTEHKVQVCSVKVDASNPFPFAKCFVCQGTGHLSKDCSQNERGLYPNGGGCKYCGSVRHYAKDCKPLTQDEGVTALGTISLDQGGDDDDVFLALHRMDKEKSIRRAMKMNGGGGGNGNATQKQVIKKKVVSF